MSANSELLVVIDEKRKSSKCFNRFPEIPFWFSLRSTRSHHALAKAFDVSKKTPLTSNPSSNNL